MDGQADAAADDDEVVVRLELSIGGDRVEAEAYVPRQPTRPLRMLPVFQNMAEVIVDRAVRSAELNGLTISCKAGCGACCRQLVPLSDTEAHHVRELVEQMPEPRRSEILARFAAARRRLAETDMLERLEQRERLSDDDIETLGLDYFRQGVACPFLEDESCSIHPDRPISCREFLVTTSAEHCATPSRSTVKSVPLPGRVSKALARVDGSPTPRNTWWVPLTLALDWAEQHPDDAPLRPGPEILQRVLELMAEFAPAKPDDKAAAKARNEKKRRAKRRR